MQIKELKIISVVMTVSAWLSLLGYAAVFIVSVAPYAAMSSSNGPGA